GECGAFRSDRIAELPTPKKRAKTTAVAMIAAVARRGQRVLVIQLPESAPRWGGMWQFPNVELEQGESNAAAVARAIAVTGLRARAGEHLGRITHSVTRYRITLDAHAAVASGSLRNVAARWQALDELGELAMPSAHRKIANLILGL